MTKYTGWELDFSDTGYLDGVVAAATVTEAADRPENEWCARTVAYCFDEGQARLIAAAPDLLAAAKLALQIAEYQIGERLDGTNLYDETMALLQPARAAIAKAEGPG